jgi:hemerythrin
MHTQESNSRPAVRMPRPDHNTLPYAMACLAASPDERFAAGFAALIAGLEYAFRQEEDTMERIGLPLSQHRARHGQLLAALAHSERRVAAGDLAAGRMTLQLAQEWYALHRETMDAAMAGAPAPSGMLAAIAAGSA